MKWKTLAALFLVALCGSALASTEADQQAVAQSMKQIWDRPEAALHVAPVTVQDDYAIAGWTQGERGGRALLKRSAQGWRVVTCAGDGLLDTALLGDAGLPPAQAEALLKAVRDAEAAQPAERVRQFALFQGTVNMGAHAH